MSALDELRALLENPDQGTFQEVLVRGQDVLDVDDRECADLFEVSVSTVARWREGKTRPAKIVREFVYEQFLQRAQKDLLVEQAFEVKSAWAKSLKVGDEVCDCRYQHLKIAEIKYFGEGDDDILLVLEDGARCSALYCCDPVDHEWSHDEDGETE